jgi:hypothetical protein
MCCFDLCKITRCEKCQPYYWDRFAAVTEVQFGGLMMQDYAKYGVVDMVGAVCQVDP